MRILLKHKKHKRVEKMKNIKNILLTFVLIVLSISMVACGKEADEAGGGGTNKDKEAVTIKHELGEITLESKAEKIIVFDYGVLDSLDTIGETVIGLPKKTLPSYLDKYSSEDYKDVGSLQEPNFELIYELEPDLIIISERQADKYEEFKEIAPTLYLNIDGAAYIDSFKNNLNILGQIFEKEDKVSGKIKEVEEKIGAIKKKTAGMDENGLFVMANDGSLSVYGSDSRFGLLYNELGISPVDESIDSSTHGQKISFEYIVDKDPDYIFVMDRAMVTGAETSAEKILDNDLMKMTKAYKNNNITYLDAHIWYVSAGGIKATKTMIDEVLEGISK